jgi:hypothetical protein
MSGTNAVRDIPSAGLGFNLIFADRPFPGRRGFSNERGNRRAASGTGGRRQGRRAGCARRCTGNSTPLRSASTSRCRR